jgi:hypothetical protein
VVIATLMATILRPQFLLHNFNNCWATVIISANRPNVEIVFAPALQGSNQKLLAQP